MSVPRAHAQLSGFKPYIVNGILTADFPTTGALLFGTNPGNAYGICSGTLIGCETFLTAGHCVCATSGLDCVGANAPNPARYFVYLQHGGTYAVASIALRADFEFPYSDVAVLKLKAPVDGIPPTAINTTTTPSPGSPGTIVGFGRVGGSNYDYGIKYAGNVAVASCTNGLPDSNSVCWNFNNPYGPAGSNSNTCNGDSGGPLFMDFGAGPRLAGVTSGGDSSTCFPVDHSFDANVFTYQSWINFEGGSDLNNTTCGTIPQVGGPEVSTFTASGFLNDTVSTALHSFQVAPRSKLLRVTLNATSDFDLYVKAGSPATVDNYDCKDDGASPFAGCEFTAPVAGTWYVLVLQYGGPGDYQMTATKFGIDCSDPANDGRTCDDGNSCTDTDICTQGVCAGTVLPDTTPCDDNDPCTQFDTCQLGTCSGMSQPRTGCQQPFVPARGVFRLFEPARGSDRLTWKWNNGTAITKDAFGDPVHSTDYALCVYDVSGGAPAVVLDKRIPAGGACGKGACWKERTASFRYTDRAARTGGISSLFLKTGLDGKAQIIARGKGPGLNPPTLPFDPATNLTVQLSNGTSCWESHFSSNTKDTLTEYRATSE